MNETSILNRRQFLRTTGQATAAFAAASSSAPELLSAPTPGNTTGVGCTGLGTRGGDLIDAVAHVPSVKVVAVTETGQTGDWNRSCARRG
jgi:hypothetical protein